MTYSSDDRRRKVVTKFSHSSFIPVPVLVVIIGICMIEKALSLIDLQGGPIVNAGYFYRPYFLKLSCRVI